MIRSHRVGFPRGDLFFCFWHHDHDMASEEMNQLWIRESATNVDVDSLSSVLSRYRLSSGGDVWQWITSFDRLITRDEKQWFLSHLDFTRKSQPGEFVWNEYEVMSLEAAEDDRDWKDSIALFWSNHLPLYMDVRSGYRALVARISRGDCHGVFESIGPEFEDVTLVASSISDMCRLMLSEENV